MSVAHIEQFYSKAVKDPALVNKMVQGFKSPDDFIRSAVVEGKKQGYDFTYEEADAWIKKQQKAKASGELSDSQLESVAGGKGNVGNTIVSGITASGNAEINAAQVSGNAEIGAFNTVVGGVTSVGNTIASGATSAANSVAHFFSSW
jgi:predicted ribosomally synthesized peptide with nif11-like leader